MHNYISALLNKALKALKHHLIWKSSVRKQLNPWFSPDWNSLKNREYWSSRRFFARTLPVTPPPDPSRIARIGQPRPARKSSFPRCWKKSSDVFSGIFKKKNETRRQPDLNNPGGTLTHSQTPLRLQNLIIMRTEKSQIWRCSNGWKTLWNLWVCRSFMVSAS